MDSTQKQHWDQSYDQKKNGWSWNFNSLCYWTWKFNLKGGRALDLGCGIGEKAWLMQRLGMSPIFGIDFSTSAIKEAKKLFPGINFLQKDLEDLSSFQENDFAMILDNKTLAFIQDKEEYLAAVAEKLSGFFLVDIPHVHKKPITIGREEFLQLIQKDFEIVDEKLHSSEDQVIGWYALKKKI